MFNAELEPLQWGVSIYECGVTYIIKPVDSPMLRSLLFKRTCATMASWKFPFSAIDPNNTSAKWPVGISPNCYRRICNQGHEKQQARIILIEEVFRDTVAIYSGWGRAGKQDDCFIYVGKPREDYHKLSPTICVPAPPGMVFLVFVLEDGEIDDWTWRRHADGDISKPLSVDGKPIWLPNQS